MASLMRLQPHHKQYHVVESPLVAGAQGLPKEEIEQLVQAHLDAPSPATREAAIMAFASIIRHITGRFIGTFRTTTSMEDDLISVAFEVVMNAVDTGLPSNGCCRVISNRICRAHTAHVNTFRTSFAPSVPTQLERRERGERPAYAIRLKPEHDEPGVDYFLKEFEFFESLTQSDLTGLEREVIQPWNWGKSIRQLTDELDHSYREVREAVNHVYELAKEIAYAD